MNDMLVASGVAGLIVGLLLAWRYLRRVPVPVAMVDWASDFDRWCPCAGHRGRRSALGVDREHQLVEFV